MFILHFTVKINAYACYFMMTELFQRKTFLRICLVVKISDCFTSIQKPSNKTCSANLSDVKETLLTEEYEVICKLLGLR